MLNYFTPRNWQFWGHFQESLKPEFYFYVSELEMKMEGSASRLRNSKAQQKVDFFNQTISGSFLKKILQQSLLYHLIVIAFKSIQGDVRSREIVTIVLLTFHFLGHHYNYCYNLISPEYAITI